MLRSLFSGITGLRSHQTMMDVVGNNIANVNSVGYKSSNVIFEDTLSQLMRAAGSPQGTNGGINPAQVGLGVKVAGISTNFSQGAAQLTGRSTDLMIQGDGFFVVKDAGQTLYTRAGAFSLDAMGRLTTPDGAIVQGWSAVNGVINTNATADNVQLPIGTLLPPTATGTIKIGGNVPAGTADYDATTKTPTLVTTITAYDSQGNAVPVTMTLSAGTADAQGRTWTVVATMPDPAGGNPIELTGATNTVHFLPDGTLDPANPASGTIDLTPPTGSTMQPITLDVKGLTQFGGANTLASLEQNGSGMGTLQGFTISPDGTLIGVFSNGLKQPLAQIAMASFNNPPGLEKVGNSSYRDTVNSGTPQVGVSGNGGRGLISGGALEMSNVDLAAEFTQLIVSQRGFQANSRVITASDEILQDLVNLKR